MQRSQASGGSVSNVQVFKIVFALTLNLLYLFIEERLQCDTNGSVVGCFSGRSGDSLSIYVFKEVIGTAGKSIIL